MSDDFDEDLYLAVNDDVRMAVANGGFKSGYEHWLMYGKQEEALGYRKSHINKERLKAEHFEEENLMSDDFDEDLYLALNDDVRMAVASSSFKSGYEHWLKYGKQEEALGHRKSHINQKIPCLILVYRNIEIIQECINYLLDFKNKLDLYVVENHSINTDKFIKPWILDLVESSSIKKYFLFSQNISNNALETVFGSDELDLNTIDSKYILFTDGDTLPLDSNWLSEELSILSNNSEVFCCSLTLDESNLPVESFPESVDWVPPPLSENSQYIEGHTGLHFLLIKKDDFVDFMKYKNLTNQKYRDSVMHNYCYQIYRKWAKTKKARAKHLTWDLYQDRENAYTKLKTSKTQDEIWSHNFYSSFEVYEKSYYMKYETPDSVKIGSVFDEDAEEKQVVAKSGSRIETTPCKTNDIKVFGIGLFRTGTTTLGECLRILGFNYRGWQNMKVYTENNISSIDLCHLWYKEEYEKLLSLVDTNGWNGLYNAPWSFPNFYKIIDEYYSNCKFILTIRDSQRWINSVIRIWNGYSPGPPNSILMPIHAKVFQREGKLEKNGRWKIKGFEEHYKQIYEKHNKSVLHYFQNRPSDLLALDWEKGDGWEKLCDFLKKPIPDQPLPWLNH